MREAWSKSAIGDVIAYLRDRQTDEFLILENGNVRVHESFTDVGVSDVKAIQKALFALLIGAAVDRGVVRTDDPMRKFLPAGWTQMPGVDEERLTIRHILTMTTGMDDALEPAGEIGTTWRYNNTAYNYLKRVLIEQTGRPLQALTDEWICDPLGITCTRWVERDTLLPDGRAVTGLEMSGLDMATLGLLVLNHGTWDGKQLISRTYWQTMLSPGSSANPAWCFMWWRNDQDHFMTPYVDRVFRRPVIPEAPTRLLFAQGLEDNRIYIDPGNGRVIVRRGRAAARQGERHSLDRELWRLMRKIWPDDE